MEQIFFFLNNRVIIASVNFSLQAHSPSTNKTVHMHVHGKIMQDVNVWNLETVPK